MKRKTARGRAKLEKPLNPKTDNSAQPSGQRRDVLAVEPEQTSRHAL